MKYDDTPSFTDKLRQSSPTYIVRSTMNVNNVNRVPLVKVEVKLLGVLPTKTSQLTNDDFTVKDQYYVHTDNNFTDVYRDMLLTLDSSLSELAVKSYIVGVIPTKQSKETLILLAHYLLVMTQQSMVI